jgi:hypothetical protein
VAVVVFAEVREGQIVTPTEAIAVIFASLGGNWGMAVNPPGIGVRREPVIKILMTGIEAISEALPLNLAELLRRCIPCATVLCHSLFNRM